MLVQQQHWWNLHTMVALAGGAYIQPWYQLAGGVYTQQGHWLAGDVYIQWQNWLVVPTYNSGTGLLAGCAYMQQQHWLAGRWCLHTAVALAGWLVVPTYNGGGAYIQRWWCLHTTVVVPRYNGGGAYYLHTMVALVELAHNGSIGEVLELTMMALEE